MADHPGNCLRKLECLLSARQALKPCLLVGIHKQDTFPRKWLDGQCLVGTVGQIPEIVYQIPNRWNSWCSPSGIVGQIPDRRYQTVKLAGWVRPGWYGGPSTAAPRSSLHLSHAFALTTSPCRHYLIIIIITIAIQKANIQYKTIILYDTHMIRSVDIIFVEIEKHNITPVLPVHMISVTTFNRLLEIPKIARNARQ